MKTIHGPVTRTMPLICKRNCGHGGRQTLHIRTPSGCSASLPLGSANTASDWRAASQETTSSNEVAAALQQS